MSLMEIKLTPEYNFALSIFKVVDKIGVNFEQIDQDVTITMGFLSLPLFMKSFNKFVEDNSLIENIDYQLVPDFLPKLSGDGIAFMMASSSNHQAKILKYYEMIRKEHRDNQIIIKSNIENPNDNIMMEKLKIEIKKDNLSYFNDLHNFLDKLGILDEDIAKFQFTESVKNTFLPSENIQNAIENKEMMTIEMYIFNVLGRKPVSGETITLGRMLAKLWREETGEEPLENINMLMVV